MRYSKSFKVMVAGLFLLFSLSALAANSGSLTLTGPAQLNGKQLPSGQYKVKWEGTGQDVQVSILQGKNVVATAPAKLVDAANKESGNSVVVNHDGGATTIHEIHLGKNKVLVFETGAGGSAAQTSVR